MLRPDRSRLLIPWKGRAFVECDEFGEVSSKITYNVRKNDIAAMNVSWTAYVLESGHRLVICHQCDTHTHTLDRLTKRACIPDTSIRIGRQEIAEHWCHTPDPPTWLEDIDNPGPKRAREE